MDSTTTMICHFREYLKGWNDKVNSAEGMHSKALLTDKIKSAMKRISNVLCEAEEKVMKKYTEEVNQGKALVDLQSKPFHKELTKAHAELTSVLYEIERVYELQNRLIDENYKLRIEITKK